jgi:DNA mismatch endonuclease, patch repair protein
LADVVDSGTRSRMMSGIRSKDTKPEWIIRKGLHRRGFRYRLHSKHVYGKPDLVLPKYNAVIFVSGCFWHGHDCYLFKMPATRKEFWEAKIKRNQQRDAEVREKLREDGWRHLTVWECAIRGREKIGEVETLDAIIKWLTGDEITGEVRGMKCL